MRRYQQSLQQLNEKDRKKLIQIETDAAYGIASSTAQMPVPMFAYANEEPTSAESGPADVQPH
jgi:dTDP-D-glucose 4,6-dehydratase